MSQWRPAMLFHIAGFVSSIVLVGCAAGAKRPTEQQQSSCLPTDLQCIIDAYADLGPTHLSGTQADASTSRWIADRLSSIPGLDVQLQNFTLPGGPLWIPDSDGSPSAGFGCRLVIRGTDVPCYVVQKPPLAPVDLHELPMRRVLVRNIAGAYIHTPEEVYGAFRLQNGTLPFDAAIVVSWGQSPDLWQSNWITQPRPFDWDQASASPADIPIVTVSPAYRHLLREQPHPNLTEPRVTELSLHGRWVSDATSRNVLAWPRKPVPDGCDLALGRPVPIYVGTPFNGFFNAAGERGAGVALVAAVAAQTAQQPPQCGIGKISAVRCKQVIFGFTSGHEQSDPGITEGVIPYLQHMGQQLNVSLADIPFVSIGANVGVYASFAGRQDEGAGKGVTTLSMKTSAHVNGSSMGDKVLDAIAVSISMAEIKANVSQGIMSLDNTEGAVVQAMKAGMPSMNVVGGKNERFHVPADSGSDSVNITALQRITSSLVEAVRSAVCAEASTVV